jgi:SAM-dependent methyltransferase
LGKGTCYPFVEKYLSSNVVSENLILETGCGGALYRQYISALYGIYIGCDVPNLQYQSGNDVDLYCSGNTLSFANNSFDLIFNQAAFDYIPNPKLTISEAYRVLRPGGIFTIFTYRLGELEKIDKNCKIRNRDWERNHHVYSGQELITWLTNQGFYARDITRTLDTIGSIGYKRKIMDFFRIYYILQAKFSIWRVFEARKPI